MDIRQNRKKNLKMVSWNANNSILEKIGQLRLFVRKHQFDIGIMESKLKLKKTPPSIDGYEFIFKNRETQHSAGELILYNTIEYEEILTNTRRIESLGIKIAGQNLYSYVRTNIGNFGQDLDTLITGENQITLIGYFNARHTTWNNPNNKTRGRSLMNHIERHNLEIIAPEEHTRISNVPGHIDSTINIAVVKNMNIGMKTLND